MKLNKQKGFTLIELLVVIAIIGILSSIVMVSLNTARIKARDARRQSDIRQISLAMEMYYDSQSPVSYPNISDAAAAIPAATAIGTYLDPIPLDPSITNNYQWADNNSPFDTYCAWVKLEGTTADTYVLANPSGVKHTTTAPNGGNCKGL